jgi:RNA polymerase sigma-70 factor (ECF subfamily)
LNGHANLSLSGADMANWNEIITDHGPVVVRVASRILGNAADVEDVTQDVFCQAFQLWEEQTIENWPALLRSIATRRAIDRLRRRQPVVPLPDDLPTDSASPSADLAEKELAHRLRVELARLPEHQANVFAVRYFEELSNQEIAEALGISTSNVSTSLTKARDSLSHRLADIRCGDAR